MAGRERQRRREEVGSRCTATERFEMNSRRAQDEDREDAERKPPTLPKTWPFIRT